MEQRQPQYRRLRQLLFQERGIEDLPQTKESQTVRSEVYTIDGKRIEADQMGRGLYIIRDIQADGSVHTRKVMRK